jgi:hypothetical protein
MGSWGPRVFENDHAADLLSIETDRWATELDKVLSRSDASWDDIEGPLIYPHLLASVGGDGSLYLGKTVGRPQSSREIAEAWKARYLELYAKKPTQSAERRAVIEQTFDALIALAQDDDAPEPPQPASKAKKAAPPKKGKPKKR